MRNRNTHPAGYPEVLLAFVIIMTLSFTFRELLFTPDDSPTGYEHSHSDSSYTE